MDAPRLTVLAGPTAVGKGTVSADVRARYPQVWLSVSATTRPPRPGEVDGVHYHFVAPEDFDRMVQQALRVNNDLAIAGFRLQQARLQAGLAGNDLLPQLSGSVSTSSRRFSSRRYSR